MILRVSVRRRLLRRFPYAFLYKIKPSSIRILAVMNFKRRPTYCRVRILAPTEFEQAVLSIRVRRDAQPGCQPVGPVRQAPEEDHR